jgi:RNA polymerase sigma factor (sigma-70 family)
MGMIVSLAKKFTKNDDPERHRDLIQEGVTAYLDAFSNFKQQEGVKFSSYAYPFVRKAMLNFVLRNKSIINQLSTDGARKAFFNISKMSDNVGKLTEAEAKSIAERLGISASDIFWAERAVATTTVDVCETHSVFIDNERFFIDDNGVSAEINKEQAYSIALKKALKKLNSKKLLVIKSRYFCEKKTTLKTLASTLSMSIEGVRSMEKFAFGEIRSAAESNMLSMEY